MFTNKTSLIIPTKDRSDQIYNLINKIFKLKLNFQEIIIVDSSQSVHSEKVKKTCLDNNIKYFHTKPSTAHQRNFGLSKIQDNDLVMFMDDDVIFFDDTFKEMNNCILEKYTDQNIVGFGFNQIELKKNNIIEKLKTSKLIKYFEIYPSVPGKVAKSGWHSKILNLNSDVLGDWVFTTICLFKRKEIINYEFDETFGEYSYLEDLDFSLNLTSEKKKIYISSKAKFKHPYNIDRSNFKFGVIEMVNRYKIINKHKLSKKLFFIGFTLRLTLSLVRSLAFNKKYFLRFIGNIYSLLLLRNNN